MKITIFRGLLVAVLSLSTFGCASGPSPKTTQDATRASATETSSAALVAAPQGEPCDLVCERARVVQAQAHVTSRAADEPDYHARATANADQVLDAMHDDLLACYKARGAVNPWAHGSILVDIVIGPDGHVRTVETAGGALLGPSTMSCMVQRIRRATFAPPHGGGTLRIQVPFTLRRGPAGEDT